MSRTAKTPKPREVIELALRSIRRRKLKGREKESYLLSLLKKNIKEGLKIEDRDDQGNTLLLLFVREGLLTEEVFLYLKDRGADPGAKNGEGQGLGHFAVAHYLNEAKLLMKGMGDFNYFGESIAPILRLLETLAKAGVRFMSPLPGEDRSPKSDPPLLQLIRNSPFELHSLNLMGLLEAIVAGGEDINARDSRGRTLLTAAYPVGGLLGLHLIPRQWEGGDFHLVKKLDRAIELGLDVNAPDLNGDTALIHLAKSKSSPGDFALGSYNYLLFKGADPYVRNARGETLVSELLRLNQSQTLELGFKLLSDYICTRGVPTELFPIPPGPNSRKNSDFLNFFFNRPGNLYPGYPRINGIIDRTVYAILFASTLPELQEFDKDYLIGYMAPTTSSTQLNIGINKITDIAQKQGLNETFLRGFFKLFNTERYQDKLSLGGMREFKPEDLSRFLSFLLQGMEADPDGVVKFISIHLRDKLQELVSKGNSEVNTFVSRLATVIKGKDYKEKNSCEGELNIDTLLF